MIIAVTTRLLPNIVPNERNDTVVTTGISGNVSWDVAFSKNGVLCAVMLNIICKR